MKIKPLHPNFQMPTRGTALAGGYDIYMPEGGVLYHSNATGAKVPLGFAAEVPEGNVALLLPRSGVGCRNGLELNNTCGVIDADYRGEWCAFLRIKDTTPFIWQAGERLLQMLIVPVSIFELELAETLSPTGRGNGGWGSTGK